VILEHHECLSSTYSFPPENVKEHAYRKDVSAGIRNKVQHLVPDGIICLEVALTTHEKGKSGVCHLYQLRKNTET